MVVDAIDMILDKDGDVDNIGEIKNFLSPFPPAVRIVGSMRAGPVSAWATMQVRWCPNLVLVVVYVVWWSILGYVVERDCFLCAVSGKL